MLLAAFFTALPLGIYFLQNPADFFGRTAQTSVLTAQNPAMALGQSLLMHLAMFNLWGDANWRHNFAGAPELFFPVGILFIIGIIYLAKKLLLKTPDAQNDEKIAYWTLLLWLGFLMLPGILTSEGIPHALRAIGVIPAAYIIAAVGTMALWDWMIKKWNKVIIWPDYHIPGKAACAFIALIACFGFHQYFIQWAKNPNVQGAFTRQFVDIADLTLSFPHNYKVIILANESGVQVPYPDGIPMPAQTVIYSEFVNCYKKLSASPEDLGYYPEPYSPKLNILEKIKNCTENRSKLIYIKPEEIEKYQNAADAQLIFVPMKNVNSVFEKLTSLYPQGQIKIKNNIKYYEID